MLWWASNESHFYCNYGSWTPIYSIVKYACWKNGEALLSHKLSLRQKCPNTEFFLLRVFLHLDWIRRDTKYLYPSVFSPNSGKYGPEKTPYLDTFHTVFTTNNWGLPLGISLLNFNKFAGNKMKNLEKEKIF